MNIQEIREIIDYTIKSNNNREITGDVLNAALHSIVDLVEENIIKPEIEDSYLSYGLTILIPSDNNFANDNKEEKLIENNKKVYKILKSDTKNPLYILSLIYNSNTIPNQCLYIKKEDNYIDFAPYTISEDYNIKLIQTYRLDENGLISKVDKYGFIELYPDGKVPSGLSSIAETLIGQYSQLSILPPLNYNVLISRRGNDLWISSLLDNQTDILIDIVENETKIKINSGWAHQKYGIMKDDIYLNIVIANNVNLYANSTIVFSDTNTKFSTYSLTKLS